MIRRLRNLKKTLPARLARKVFMRFYIPYLGRRLTNAESTLMIRGQEYKLRLAKESDHDALYDFYMDELDPSERSYPESVFRSNLSDPANKYFTLRADGSIVAYAKMSIKGFRNIELGIAVSKNHRRRGIADSIISHLERFCDSNGLRYFVIISRWNEASIKLFEKRGYSIFMEEPSLVYMRVVKSR